MSKMAKINDENAHAYSHLPSKSAIGSQTPLVKRNQMVLSTTGSIRKNAFNDLRNVMQNGLSTPANAFRPTTVSVCTDVLRKQNIPKKQAKIQSSLEDEDENLYDYFDHGCCTANCRKSDQEIWSEMDLIDDPWLDRVLRGGDPDSDEADDGGFDIKIADRSCPDLEELNLTSYLNISADADIMPELPPAFADDIFGTEFDPYII